MASTDVAARLTEAHRLAQSRLAARIVRQVLASWGLIDLHDIDGSAQRWIDLVTPVIEGQIISSARLAANYLAAFRALEVGAGTFVPTLAPGSPSEAIRRSLLVTGPVNLKRSLDSGVPLSRALDVAKAKSAGAATRHTLSGGRDTIIETIQADRQAVGYSRATSSKPCAFCAMLASRGHVYKSSMTAGFKPHDACHCVPEPAYSIDAPLTPSAQRFGRLWNESTRSHRGQDAINAFRRAYERPAVAA